MYKLNVSTLMPISQTYKISICPNQHRCADPFRRAFVNNEIYRYQPILWGQPRSLIARIYMCVFLMKRHRYVLHPFLHFGRASSLNRDDRLRLRAPGDFSLSAGHPKEERGVVKFRRMRWAKFSITFAAAVNVELCSRFTLAFPALFLHKNIYSWGCASS
jgi:hypothetical protein